MGYYPRLFGWYLNAIKNVFISERQREVLCTQEKRTQYDQGGRDCSDMAWPQAKECWQLPEAGRDKEQILS